MEKMTKDSMKQAIVDKLRLNFGCTEEEATEANMMKACAMVLRDRMSAHAVETRSKVRKQQQRQVHYMSLEFLMGRSLMKNAYNLGVIEPMRAAIEELGFKPAHIFDMEPDAGLGNGGLGRLAACFLDSIAALGLQGDGVGLNYHYGLFHQRFSDNKQMEVPDPWMEPDSWLIPTGVSFNVPFGGFDLKAVLYDIAIPGANNQCANRLHLFDVAEPADAPWVGIDFDKGDIAHRLTSFLYPDDSDEAGRLLRVYQQYFMVSAGAQLILAELEAKGYALNTLADHVVVQINDTHPSMVIPELIRLLTEKGMSFDDALDQVRRTCAYTNHTILAEALEKWPLAFIQKAAPQLVPILRELDQRAKAAHPDPKTAILQTVTHKDGDGKETAQEIVHMAHLDIHYGYSVNGVAALHTEILKSSELKHFYDLYPAKFNNKTNGVTLRRWLEVCNPQLAALLDECVGPEWRTDPGRLNKLTDFSGDSAVLDKMLEIKAGNKRRASELFARDQDGIRLDPDAVFDVQVKRLHEYKRQQMNALYIIHKYLEIKEGRTPDRPVTVIFGAKAAPAYVMAKHIIHLILCLRKLIEEDPQVRPWLHVAMVENYNVTWAERLIPACDISEQISLASKEASGTGNMKFMANGAVTLGTLDGANVEIAELVGPDNIYTFGAGSGEVIRMYAGEGEKQGADGRSYLPLDYYHRPAVERLVDFLVSPELLAIGDPASLSQLWRDMKNKDWFMALLDVEAYIAARDRAIADYGDRTAWAKKMLVNTARSGFFSSDRTIAQYNRDIWHLK